MSIQCKIALILMGWGLLVVGVAMCFAPEGYEDETGFHYGKPQQKE